MGKATCCALKKKIVRKVFTLRRFILAMGKCKPDKRVPLYLYNNCYDKFF